MTISLCPLSFANSASASSSRVSGDFAVPGNPNCVPSGSFPNWSNATIPQPNSFASSCTSGLLDHCSPVP
jgi:hypothetical protein